MTDVLTVLVALIGAFVGSFLVSRYWSPWMLARLEARAEKRWRQCGAECGRKLPPEMFAEGALNCRDCVSVRLLADDLMQERVRALRWADDPIKACADFFHDENRWDEAVREARERLGVL